MSLTSTGFLDIDRGRSFWFDLWTSFLSLPALVLGPGPLLPALLFLCFLLSITLSLQPQSLFFRLPGFEKYPLVNSFGKFGLAFEQLMEVRQRGCPQVGVILVYSMSEQYGGGVDLQLKLLLVVVVLLQDVDGLHEPVRRGS